MSMNPITTVVLESYSSLRTGGEGSLVVVDSVSALREALTYAREHNLHVHIIGGGTNTYFGEDLSSFLFVKFDIRGVEIVADTVIASAGEMWDELVARCVEEGLWGIENLSYIPGTVGAAPVQNIGAYGAELSYVCESVDVFDILKQEIVTISKEACHFGYRDSVFKYKQGRYVILSVRLNLSRTPKPILLYKPLDALPQDASLQTIREKVIAIRKEKLPDWREHANAGSFFKNPILDTGAADAVRALYPELPLIEVPEGYKVPAAWLIEHVAEMKGVRIGDVGTWPQQPLVIVNFGLATADDIDTFAKEIKDSVYQKTGIVLEQEVNRVG